MTRIAKVVVFGSVVGGGGVGGAYVVHEHGDEILARLRSMWSADEIAEEGTRDAGPPSTRAAPTVPASPGTGSDGPPANAYADYLVARAALEEVLVPLEEAVPSGRGSGVGISTRAEALVRHLRAMGASGVQRVSVRWGSHPLAEVLAELEARIKRCRETERGLFAEVVPVRERNTRRSR